MNKRLPLLFALCIGLLWTSPAAAQLSGTDTKPGDACTSAEEGHIRRNASADRDVSEITLICDDSVWQSAVGSGGGGSLNCPSGFTKMEAAGNVLGCIENTYRTATWGAALVYCSSNYGGTLPSLGDRYIADNSFGISNGSGSSGREWVSAGVGTGDRCPVYRENDSGTFDSCSTNYRYRCFIPAGASGGSGSGSDTLAGLSCANDEIAKWNGSAWACAADESGGVSDGDKGDVTVSGSGATWMIDNDAVTSAKIQNSAVTPAKTDFVGTLEEGKWCTVSGGDIVCTSDAPSGGGGAGPSDCPVPGNTCSDGSKYAGSIYGWTYFITDADQSTSSNHNEAIPLCDNLNRHSKTDWTLPSLGVLDMLFENRAEIGGLSGSYWSSRKESSGDYWVHSFSSTGAPSVDTWMTDNRVRCVRRN